VFYSNVIITYSARKNWHAQQTICAEISVGNKNYGSANDKSYRTARMKMKLFSVLPICLRKCVNLNNSFVPYCVKIHRIIEFYYAGLAKSKQKNLGTIRFVVIIVVLRKMCESRTLYGSYEILSCAAAWNRDWCWHWHLFFSVKWTELP